MCSSPFEEYVFTRRVANKMFLNKSFGARNQSRATQFQAKHIFWASELEHFVFLKIQRTTSSSKDLNDRSPTVSVQAALGHHYFLTNVSSMSRSLFFIGVPNPQLHANFSHGIDRVAFMFFKALPSIISN